MATSQAVAEHAVGLMLALAVITSYSIHYTKLYDFISSTVASSRKKDWRFPQLSQMRSVVGIGGAILSRAGVG